MIFLDFGPSQALLRISLGINMLAKILDFIPALAFFITYRVTGDLILATGVIIAGCTMSFALQYILWKRKSRIGIFMLAAVLIFGLPTIFLQDPAYIKLKVTVVNWVLACTLFVFQYVLHKNPLSYLFGQEMPIPEHIFSKLATAFMFYFVFMGALNLTIAFFLPTLFGIEEKVAESYWVSYKTFGSILINCTFTGILFFVMMRRYPEMLDAFKETAKAKISTGRTAPKNNATDSEFESERNS